MTRSEFRKGFMEAFDEALGTPERRPDRGSLARLKHAEVLLGSDLRVVHEPGPPLPRCPSCPRPEIVVAGIRTGTIVECLRCGQYWRACEGRPNDRWWSRA